MSKDQIELNVGLNDKIPYIKVDLSKACRVGSNFALSFYQLDYQALAYSLNNQSSVNPSDSIMPVAKIVFSHETLIQIQNEIKQILDQFEKSKDSGK